MDAKYEAVLQCDLCGNSETKLVDEQGRIVQCKRCSLKFVGLRPTQGDISEGYNWSYGNCPGWGEVAPQGQKIYDKRLKFMEKFIRRGQVLDVGAGRGEFLSKAKGTNRWRCFGTDTSQYAVDFAKKEFGINLSLGQLEDLGYQEKSFDVVTLWHVLEHLPYPSKTLEEIRRILKDDGFLFIAVPNDSWLARRPFFKNAFKKAINRLPIRKKLKLKKMYPEIDEEGNKHLFYFTPRTVTRLLKRHGFQIKRCSVDYNFAKPDLKIERRYRFALLFCNLTGINLFNAILIAAQKR